MKPTPRQQRVNRKGGAPQKEPDGLNKVLFVRASQALLDKLDELRRQRSEKTRITFSRSDLARAILWEAIERGAQ